MNGWLERWLSRFGYVQLIDSTNVPPRLMAVAGCACGAGARGASSAATAPPSPASSERRVNPGAADSSVIGSSFAGGARRRSARESVGFDLDRRLLEIEMLG